MRRLTLIVGVLVCTLCLPEASGAEGFSYSKSGKNFSLTFHHSAECDSAGVWFAYPDTTNYYYRVTAFPSYAHSGDDSSHLVASGLSLDSIGNHIVKIYYFEHDGDAVLDGYASGAYFHDDDITTTVGAGTGPNSVIIRCKSETDSAAIPGATIAVWNSDETALMRLRSTDTDSGKAEFNLDNGTYKLRIVKYKFQWATPIALGVSANKDTTIYATEFTPSPPPYDSMCTVYGYVDSAGLTAAPAFVHITIHTLNLRVGTLVLAHSSYTKKIRINSSGYWEAHLWPNALITPAATTYHIRIETPYMVVEKYVTVPQTSTWEFTW